MADAKVLQTQQWLNSFYTGKAGYNPIDLSDASVAGHTGWTTIYALIRAFQVELGITATANNFGAGTIRLFNEKYPNGIEQPADSDTATSGLYGGVYGIIQGALWCKGYAANYNGINQHFDAGTASGLVSLKEDAGLSDTSATVTLHVMQALLSMNQYKLVSGGNSVIRAIQQHLNSQYEDYIGLAPCDGDYSRDMNKAMIKVLQAIEGYSVANATGNFGAGTKSGLSKLLLPSSGNAAAIYLFRAALVCNGYNVELSDSWDDSVTSETKTFQADMQLPQSGEGDLNTWMALLISCGNTDRSSNGCDTRFEMTDERLATLKANGYEVVGRYLTGGDFKQLRPDEPARIINAGMKFFPIFQESGTNIAYFTADQGKADAASAIDAAWGLGIPAGAIIYFAVDMDPTDAQISNSILPYFEAVADNITSVFKVGVYGTRNVCTQVCGKNYATTSFVSDMSYGFSGNMGFKMPTDWNFDQFHEISSANSGWDFDLDKTTYSRSFPVVTELNEAQTAPYTRPAITPLPADRATIYSFVQDFSTLEDLYVAYKQSSVSGIDLARGITNFLRSQAYSGSEWKLTTGYDVDQEFVTYVQAQNADLYNRLYPYIQGAAERLSLSDGADGQIDLSHLAATMEAYWYTAYFPQFWAGWGGDLATGMNDVTKRYDNGVNPDPTYDGKTVQEVANMTIGSETSSCNYSDLCSDFDAYALAQQVQSIVTDPTHPFSAAISWYYGLMISTRFQQIFTELDCEKSFQALYTSVLTSMTGTEESIPVEGLLASKAGNPTTDVIQASCYAFVSYIMSMQ